MTGPDPDICGDRFVLPGDAYNDAYVCQGRPGHIESTGVMHGGPNPAGKSAAWGDTAGVKDHPEEPALIRLSKLHDLIREQQQAYRELSGRFDAYQTRVQGLHEAVKSWGDPGGSSTGEHANRVTWLAGQFAAFLANGTVSGQAADEPTIKPDEPASPPAGPPGFTAVTDMLQRLKAAPDVVAAAVAWADEAHTNNPAGPNNWRNWADEKDIRLINAVLRYQGKEPIE